MCQIVEPHIYAILKKETQRSFIRNEIGGATNKLTETIEQIFAFYGLSKDYVKSKTRVENVVEARAAACYTLRFSIGAILVDIAEAMSRDHSSIIHLVSQVDGYLKYDDRWNNNISELRKWALSKTYTPKIIKRNT